MHKKLAVIAISMVLMGGLAAYADPVDTTSVSFELGCPADSPENTLGPIGYDFLYGFYMDVFARLELEGTISTADKAQIVHFIHAYLSSDFPVSLAINDYKDGQRLVVSFILAKTEKGSVMVMKTNFDAKALKIVADGGDTANIYARTYYVQDGRFVNSRALFDAKKEQELLKAKKDVAEAKNSLADMYLFDEKKGNDSSIEPLLNEALKIAKSDAARLAPLMTLTQYYLSVGDLGKAEPLVIECDGLVKKTKANENIVKFQGFLGEQTILMKVLKPR